MTIKTCRHCDVSFRRHDSIPIPHDRCGRCHEEIEAIKEMGYRAFGETPDEAIRRLGRVMANVAKWERGDMDTRSNEHDPVTRPAHYQSDEGIECIDAIRAALGLEGFVAHCRGTAIKYAWRAGSKGDAAECLRKGAWYLERAAEELEQ